MKAKLFYLFIALVMVLSLVAVAGAPRPGTVQAATELHVVPFTLQPGGVTAIWTTCDKHTGSYSVALTTSNPGDYAGVGFTPVAGLGGYNGKINSITSLSFWFNCTAWNQYSGPRFSLLLDVDGGDGTPDHLVVSADVAEGTTAAWTQWSPDFGNSTGVNRFWYGTCNPDGSGYSEEAGPVSFNEVKTHFTGADVIAAAIYMGMVTSPPGAGSAYVDDPAVNGVTYYGRIQDALDAASPGDTINVYPGTYQENIVITESVTLQSSGDVVNTIICGDGTDPAVTIGGASPFTGTATVWGFNITADNTDAYGIDVSELSGGTVNIGGIDTPNLIHGNFHGIHVGAVDDSSEVTILHNVIYENLHDGVNFGGAVQPMNGTATIQENYIGAIYMYDPVFMPVPLDVAGNGDNGIFIHQVGADGTATIQSNIIADNTLDGIRIDSIEGEVQIYENTVGAWQCWFDGTHNDWIVGNHDNGIDIKDVSSAGSLNIEHNIISENDQDGIHFELAGGAIEGDVTIFNNRIGGYTYYPGDYEPPG